MIRKVLMHLESTMISSLQRITHPFLTTQIYFSETMECVRQVRRCIYQVENPMAMTNE